MSFCCSSFSTKIGPVLERIGKCGAAAAEKRGKLYRARMLGDTCLDLEFAANGSVNVHQPSINRTLA